MNEFVAISGRGRRGRLRAMEPGHVVKLHADQAGWPLAG
jgi:hypothetical protein